MRDALSLPNLLTWIRIALTPVIVSGLLTGDCVEAFYISWIAGLTDAADGYLARRLGRVTQVGAYLDPIADKVLLTALYVSFSAADLAPAWLSWMVVGRDVMILSLVAAGWYWKGVRDFPPSILGKLSTVFQIGTALAILSECAFGGSPSLTRGLIYATALATAVSGVHYFLRALSRLATVTR